MALRICLADDHLLFLAGIRQALENAPGIDVTGLTSRGDEVMALVDEHRPDLLLLDHRMAGAGIACLRLIKHRHPQIKVVMLSTSEDAAEIAEALGAGASAYIAKRIHPDDLASALSQVVSGVVYRSGPAAVPAAAPQTDLTPRELTMLDTISRGLSTKMISHELWITDKTVKFHLTNIYRKLGVHNRAGAMRYAFDHDLIAAAEPARPAPALAVA